MPLSQPASPGPAAYTTFASASKPPPRERSKLPAPTGPSKRDSPTAPFGPCLIAQSPRGICHFSFVDAKDRAQAETAIHHDWPLAHIRWNNSAAKQLAAQLFTRPSNGHRDAPLRAFVRGSAFQVRVWRTLLNVPAGGLISYGHLAKTIGKPTAARAVGTAVGHNPLAYIIPCHRVIQATGVLGDYRWGATRKQAIVAWETASALHHATTM